MIKRVGIENPLEPWPDKICCFTLWDGPREPYQERFYVEESEVERLKKENEHLRKLLAAYGVDLLLDPALIADVGEGTSPTYHTTTSVEEARKIEESVRKLRELSMKRWTA